MKIKAALIILFTGFWLNAQQTLLIGTKPSLSPDGKTAYFSFEGDIWKVNTNGGTADRITALDGDELNPRVSPDGKWLAFSSNQYGNYDVFVMPVDGGEIKQLTFHTGKDEIENWGNDSRTIYFTSDRSNGFASYSLSIDGGTPKRLFKNYFNTTVGMAEMPDGELIFTNSSEGAWQLYRKYYKGENNSDILGYHPKTNQFRQYTDYLGEDFQPTTDKTGKIYFVSDEDNGEYNLYRINNGRKEVLTHFDTSVKNPFVAHNGSKVIFVKDYVLFIYDTTSGQTRPLNVQLTINSKLEKSQNFNTKDEISYFDISEDGKKIGFVSRGVLFVSDIDGKFVRQITDGNERVLEVKWLKDNKTLIYNQTINGYQNWFTIVADGNGTPKQLTTDLRNNRDIAFNYDLSKAVYLSGRDQLRLMNLKNFESETIVNDEIWAFQNSSPSFSPDGRFVLYTARRDFEEDIFIYDTKDKKSINLTQTGVSENSPVWSPDGRYIYFSSDRTSPSYPLGNQQSNVYRMSLDWFDQPYKSNEFDKLFEKEKKSDKKDKDEDKTEKPKPVTVNQDDILDRIERVTERYGFQYDPAVISNGDKTFLFYNSRQDEGKSFLFRKTFEDFEKTKTEKIFEKKADLFVQHKKEVYFLSDDTLYKLSGDGTKPEEIKIQFGFDKNLASEFNQMFSEAWAGVEENFYDEKFHGKDWNALKEKYKRFLPFVTNRQDLRLLLNDMLGELNASHLGFYSNGKEESKKLGYQTSETGILFNNDDPYLVDEIIRKSPAYLKDVDIKAGDRLTAVNGKNVDRNANRNAYFSLTQQQDELTLEFDRNGKKIKTKIHPINNAAEKSLLYDDWIHTNKLNVDKWSNNRIAYVYMKNMSLSSLDQFLLDMVEKMNKKEGLILDLRYNTGGNVHDKVLNFLAQRPYLQWKYREGEFTIQSNFAPSGKPMVLLINQFSLSDAEVTAAGFKALKLGKVIGTETYRWIIFTSAKGLVDGSYYRLPSWGVYMLDGTNLEKTGVRPDIYVKNTFMDLLEGNDPQLQRAVNEVLNRVCC